MVLIRSLFFLIAVFQGAAADVIPLVQTISISEDVHVVKSTTVVPTVPTYRFPHGVFASAQVSTQVPDEAPTVHAEDLVQASTLIGEGVTTHTTRLITQVPDEAPTVHAEDLVQASTLIGEGVTTHTTRIITQVPDEAPTVHAEDDEAPTDHTP